MCRCGQHSFLSNVKRYFLFLPFLSHLRWGGGNSPLFVNLASHRRIRSRHRKGVGFWLQSLSVRNGTWKKRWKLSHLQIVWASVWQLSPCPALPFLIVGERKNKVHCHYLLPCIGRVLPDVLTLHGIEERERRKIGKYGLMKGRKEWKEEKYL